VTEQENLDPDQARETLEEAQEDADTKEGRKRSHRAPFRTGGEASQGEGRCRSEPEDGHGPVS